MIDKEQEKRNYSNMEIDKIYLGDCIEIIGNCMEDKSVDCDPFIGSGTTAIAAIREKRHFIGMELNKEYYDIAIKRVKDELNNLTLS